jgi:hypothetical protein
MEVVNKLIDTEEALVNQIDFDAKHDAGTSDATEDSSSKFRKRPSEVLAAVLTVKIRQPSHEFTFGVGITFVSYSLVLTPVV